MIIQCTKCLARFKFDETRLGDGPKKVRCTKCSEVFTVLPPGEPVPVQAPPPVAGTPSRIPTGHTLGRHPTGEFQTRRPSADDLLQSPVKARRPAVSAATDSPATSGARRAVGPGTSGKRPVSGATPKPSPGIAAGRPAAPPSSAGFSSLDALINELPPVPAKPGKEDQRPVFMTLSGITAEFDEEPSLPTPPSGSAIIASTLKGAPALDPTQLERPPVTEQAGINEELYRQSDIKLELPPLMKILREIDFDAESEPQSDLLELDMGREFEYGGSDKPRVAARKQTPLKVRPLSAARDDSIPLRPSLSRITSTMVKALFIVAILLLVLLTGVMLSQGDSFNLGQLSNLSGLVSLFTDTPPGGSTGL